MPLSPEGIANGLSRLLNNSNERTQLEKYLREHEYGNQEEVKNIFVYLTININQMKRRR